MKELYLALDIFRSYGWSESLPQFFLGEIRIYGYYPEKMLQHDVETLKDYHFHWISPEDDENGEGFFSCLWYELNN